MKQFYILSFLLVFSCSIVFAQNFEGGIMAGLNASQVEGDFTSGYHKPGIVAGGYVLTNLSNTIFAGMEIKFNQKGSRKNPDPKTGEQDKYIMRLSYIDIPVYLGIRTNDRISIVTGLSAGYLMKGTEFDNYGAFVEVDQRPFKPFDVQAMLGFRFQITDRIYVDLRAAYSVLPIRDSPGEELWYWRDNQFNNLLSTTILYRLDL